MNPALAILSVIAIVDLLRSQYRQIDGMPVVFIACVVGACMSLVDLPITDFHGLIVRGCIWGGAASGLVYLARVIGGADSPTKENS